MTIEKDEFSFEVMCDGKGCFEVEEFDRNTPFRDMIDELKDKGWRMIKGDDDAWEHFCPACAENKPTGVGYYRPPRR